MLSDNIDVETRWKIGTALYAFEPPTATAVAIALGIEERTIAAAMQRAVQELDEKGDYDSMKTIVEHLTTHPEQGLAEDEDRRLGAVGTWRLARTHPDTAEAWERAAREACQRISDATGGGTAGEAVTGHRPAYRTSRTRTRCGTTRPIRPRPRSRRTGNASCACTRGTGRAPATRGGSAAGCRASSSR